MTKKPPMSAAAAGDDLGGASMFRLGERVLEAGLLARDDEPD